MRGEHGRDARSRLPSRGLDREPIGTRVGTDITFESDRRATWAVWRADVEGRTIELLTREEGTFRLRAASADGTAVVYRDGMAGVVTWLELESGDRRPLADARPGSHFALSGDGRTVAYVRRSLDPAADARDELVFERPGG